jgi:tRNA pseudouridine38-40 synthase
MKQTRDRKIALIVEYDGSGYAGFQLQGRAPTIQGELEGAITRLTLAPARVHGAGRTDSGVHALGQVAAFVTGSALPCESIVQGLNHFLPTDIAVKAAYDAPMGFDPRRHARSRTYRYALLSGEIRSPTRERYACRVTERLDDEAMSVALKSLKGSHDFAPLSSRVPRGTPTVREVYETRLWREEDLVQFDVEANAFLRHQMRRIAGMLVSVGTGCLSLEGARAILDGHCDPSYANAAPTLPAHGLCLQQVNYEGFPASDY